MDGSDKTSSDSNAVSNAVTESMAAALRSAGLSDMIEHVDVKQMGYSENVLERVIQQHEINDRDSFLTFAHSMDEDNNNYLREDELQKAAIKWIEMKEQASEQPLDTTENDVDYLLQLGEECSRKNDSKGALSAFNKAIALDPSCDMAWFNRGVLLEAEQDARGARQAFQICLDINPNNAPATANIATLLERIGDDAAAYEMAVKALEFFPGHPMLLDVKSRCAESGLKMPLEAMPIQTPSQRFEEDVVEKAMEEVGVTDREAVLAEASHHDEDTNQHLEYQELKSAATVVAATQEIQQVLEQAGTIEPEVSEPAIVEPLIEAEIPAPQNLDEMVEQATGMIRAGDPKSALELLSPHLKTTGANHAGAWRIAGGAMARMDLDDHAISALEHAQSLDPNQGSGWFNLGSIHQRQGNASNAIECYVKAMRVQNDYLKAAMKCSQLCHETGDITNFLDATRTVLRLQPNHDIRNEFIRVLVELAEGEAHVLESVQGIPPTLPEGPHLALEALEFLGDGESELHARAYTAAKNDVQAVTVWKSMIKRDGTNAATWRGLARSLESAGDLATAEKCHRKADTLEGITNEQSQQDQHVETLPEPTVVQHVQPEPQAPAPALSHPDAESDPGEEQADFYMNALGLQSSNQQTQQAVAITPQEDSSILLESANALNQRTLPVLEPQTPPEPTFDLTQAAADAQRLVSNNANAEVDSSSVANQDIAWYNQGVGLIADGKFNEALSCFDRALPSFTGDDEMLMRILNGRGNAFYYLEDYPKCVEAYHQAMLIRPAQVQGKTLYNMGSAYAEMERYQDAIKCFEQSVPRGLTDEEAKRAKEQIRRCGILLKEVERKKKRR
ncbi:MAG: tetratricopeptide repeat protein [Candidatus Poseidoniaceae archaeon]|nr:tetratricopeptide repeat protein [Candidatus Poseidoniaceae archaeon]